MLLLVRSRVNAVKRGKRKMINSILSSFDSINFGPYQVTATGIQSVKWDHAITLSVRELASLSSQFAALTLHLKKIAEDHQVDSTHNISACALCSLFATPENGNWKGSVVSYHIVHFIDSFICSFIKSFIYPFIHSLIYSFID